MAIAPSVDTPETSARVTASGSHERLGDPPSLTERTGEQLLTRAAELVAFDWCQGALARDAEGREVEPWTASACSWSPLGALMASWYEGVDDGLDAFRLAYASLALATGGRLEEWNSARWRTRDHVQRAFTRAAGFLALVRRWERERCRSASSVIQVPELDPE